MGEKTKSYKQIYTSVYFVPLFMKGNDSPDTTITFHFFFVITWVKYTREKTEVNSEKENTIVSLRQRRKKHQIYSQLLREKE